MYSDTLKSYFPPIVTDSTIKNEILNASGSEFDNLYDKLADLQLQFDVDTATWALDIYEKDLNIITDYTKDYDSRRSVIKSKWRGNGKLTSTLIKIVCDAFTNGNVQVTYDGIIHIKFTSVEGIPPNIDDLKNVIEQIKPAHKLIDYQFLYATWGDVANYSWGDLVDYTWEEVLTGKLRVNITILYTQLSDGTYNPIEFKLEN